MGKKSLTLVIFAMAIVIAVLITYIVVNDNNNEKSNKEPEAIAITSTETATTESSTEAADEKESAEEVTEEAEEKKENSDDKSSGTDADSKKYACYATVSSGDSWQDGEEFVYQYSVDINNKSSEDLKNWEIRITGFDGAKMGDGWNAKYKIKGDTLYCTAVDYNETLAAKSTTNFGFQAKFKTSEAGKVKKNAAVYIDGELYTELKEEPTTRSKEEKEASKKEKKEPETGTPLSNHGALSVKGTDIVDKNGEAYQLKGVSTHGLAWFPQYVNKDAFKTLRDEWGANLIRLAMYTGESGGYCQDGDKDKLKGLVSDGVEYATDLGMYAIIDWHILSDNNPQTNEDEAIAFFDEMSNKYANYDNVLYEICNEPNGSTTWSDVKEYAEKVIPVIRANDKDAIIIVGTPTWSQDVDIAAEDPIKGQDNVCYAVHFYAATHKDNIRDKVKTARDKGLCVFISEFSICDASGNGGIDYDSADEWFNMIDENNISYAGWNLANKNETSSLIDSSCDKTSGWSDDELSETGVWLKSEMKND
jgi:endoglucanase